MKNLLYLIMLYVIISCSQSSGSAIDLRSESTSPSFVGKEQAKRMIDSYQKSIGFPEIDQKIRSWRINAEALRQYLSDPTITEVEIFLAHNIEYIEAGGEGLNPPEDSIVQTIVLIGRNQVSELVYRDELALNNAAPCPRMCSYAIE